ncbi:ribosome maturation factor RimP [Sinimarinibacterium sp. CAU 1509]|uniref:ribosome maturation factor RimP n=1 Tax=Sinimarinibacterium sp. CAU 1509 TaxID=2562283 RepID=UPI0010AB7F33|nr:ribosome maturation factor RimP [Sinimarinibacterium sp. CAU 1509]TJY62173.1 ribosome maturation factor RimP [Sinimarinibacterium sp. CAU 1509]
MTVLKDRLQGMLEPLVESLGYELLLLEFSPSSKSGLLRLFIDAPAGISLEDCERVSREVSGLLDVEDPISTAYRLEVSSPGFDRPLAKPAHFERFINEQARVQLVAPLNGRRRFVGWIREVGGDAVTLETADGMVEIPFVEIDRARLVPEFDRE